MKSPLYDGDKFSWRDAVVIAIGALVFIYLLPDAFANSHWWTLRAKLLGTFLADGMLTGFAVILARLFFKP